jgi:hypothetical protein
LAPLFVTLTAGVINASTHHRREAGAVNVRSCGGHDLDTFEQ